MKLKFLILYKRSLFELYTKSALKVKQDICPLRLKTLQVAHQTHYTNLQKIEKIVKTSGVSFTKRVRGTKVDYEKFTHVITVGGDGTFLEAARYVKKQIIIGVNSNPQFSLGRLCKITLSQLPKTLKDVLINKVKIQPIQRLCLKLNKEPALDFLNDILITHKNPAAISRYNIKIGSVVEEQRSSGLWIATASGSSGAIHSAGGKILRNTDSCFQYKPRELFTGFNKHYRLVGGILSAKQIIQIESCMRNGVIFIDGAHHKINFSIGQKAIITISPMKLNCIIPN